MKNKLLIPGLIIALILGLFVKDFVCNNQQITVKKKQIRKQWTRTKPLPHIVHLGSMEDIKEHYPDTVWEVITEYDTIYKTLQDYFAYVNVKDTINLDSVGKVYLNDTLHMNRIIHRDYISDVNYYTKTIHDKSNFKLFTGVFYLQSVNPSFGVNLSANVKKSMFSVGIGTKQTYLFNYQYQILKK